jgi:colicin import membrane protein
LKIQRELIDERKTLYETGAGGKLKEALKAQAEKMQAEFDRKEKAMKKAEEDALRREAESRKRNEEANRKLERELAAVKASQEEAAKSHDLKLTAEPEKQAANLQKTFNQKQTESEKQRAEEAAATTKFKQTLEKQNAEILERLEQNSVDSARLDKNRDAEITQLKALIEQLKKEAKERNVSVSEYVWSGLESARNGVSSTWNNVSNWFGY